VYKTLPPVFKNVQITQFYNKCGFYECLAFNTSKILQFHNFIIIPKQHTHRC